MEKIGGIFRKERGFKSLFKDKETALILRKNWQLLLGKLADQVHFGYLRNGQLVVYVENPLWIKEIDYYKQDLLSKMNALFDEKAVESLKVQKDKLRQEPPVLKSKKYQTFLEKIQERKKEQAALGFFPCKTCSEMMTQDGVCIFCKNTLGSGGASPI
ncbi:MAG: DUF721 domain-containing protein [Candidatus Margulisiibacteriota bacterium]